VADDANVDWYFEGIMRIVRDRERAAGERPRARCPNMKKSESRNIKESITVKRNIKIMDYK
jgi:hypothetical protein